MTAPTVFSVSNVGDDAVVEGRLMPVDVGDLAPDFALPDQDGHQWRLSDHRGRNVVLIFHRHLM
jgi:hypothetical protein